MEKAFDFTDLLNQQRSFEIFSNCFDENIILQKSDSKWGRSQDCSKEQEINEDHVIDIQSSFGHSDNKQNLNVFQKEDFENVLQQTIKNNKIKKYDVILTQSDYKYPGETKNLPKVYTRALIFFINQTIKQSLKGSELKHLASNSLIKSFIKLCPERAGRERLMKFLNSDVGKLFGEEFFGNCQWVYPLMKENKAQIQSYFRYNNIYYNEIMNPLKKQLKM